MIKIHSALALILFLTCSSGLAKSAPTPYSHFTLIGEGKMRFALMDIYHAKLLSNDGNFDADKAFALQLDYTRTISKRRLIEETRNQLLRTGTNNKNTIEKWTGHLKTIWPDIKPGDSITLFVNNEQQSIFYINHKLAGVIHDTEFTSAFSGIWLSPRTSRPKLRKNLLSIKK